MAEGSRMWVTSLLTIMLVFPLLSAAPLDIAGGVKDDNDGMHSHENVTRGGKFFSHNQFDVGNINISGSVAGDVVTIGHEIKIDVHVDDHHQQEDNTVIEFKEGLSVLFKSIDSNNNGIMDAKELLRVCHQNKIPITESLAARILTLPDKTVGFNLAKFCELLKECPSTNSADWIYFLLELYEKGCKSGEFYCLGNEHCLLLCDGYRDCNGSDEDYCRLSFLRTVENNPLDKGEDRGGQTSWPCLGSKSMGSYSEMCLPFEKPAACNPTSWEELMTLQKGPGRLQSCDTATPSHRALCRDHIVDMTTWYGTMGAALAIHLEEDIDAYDIQLETDIPLTKLEFWDATSSPQKGTIFGAISKSSFSGANAGQTLKLGFQLNYEGPTLPKFISIVLNNRVVCGGQDDQTTTTLPTTTAMPATTALPVICPYKDDLNSVILENKWRTQNEITELSEGTKRNLVVIEVELMTGHTTEDLSGRPNAAAELGSLTAIANMAALLIKYFIRSSSEVKTLTYGDFRNILVIETSKLSSIQVSTLQSMTDHQLLKRFCTACTDCMCGGKICASGSLCASGSICIPPGCKKEDNYNYYGNDIWNKKTTGQEDCANWCGAVKECKAWTLRKSDNWCWIKSSDTGRSKNNLVISGTKGCATGAFSGYIETPGLNLEAKTSLGEWGVEEKCSYPHFVKGMQIKFEGKGIGMKDDTSLNAIRLTCSDDRTISSTEGHFGSWGSTTTCPEGEFINQAIIRSEEFDPDEDNTAANGIRFRCTDGSEYKPEKGNWGKWITWKYCQPGSAVYGIQTLVQRPMGGGDDTALNNVKFLCAQLPKNGNSDEPELTLTCPSGKTFTSEKSLVGIRQNQNCWACYKEAGVDGCSAPWIDEVLDQYFGASCDIHDLCYTYPGRSKSDCDNEQFNNMMKQCGSDGVCRWWAERILFLHSKTSVSVDAYEDAQNDARGCTKTKN